MLISIVAKAENDVIGKDNTLIWHLKEDLQFFKEKTKGHVIIMGRKTFESLPCVLPDREHWVITKDPSQIAPHPRVRVFDSVMATLEAAQSLEVAYIIGGASIYESFLPYVDRMYITEIAADIEGDACYPIFSKEEFQEVYRSSLKRDAKYPWTFTFVTYDRV